MSSVCFVDIYFQITIYSNVYLSQDRVGEPIWAYINSNMFLKGKSYRLQKER